MSAPSAAINEDEGILRVDHTLSQRDNLSGVYVINDFRDALPFQVNHGASTGGNVPVGSGITDTDRNQVLALTWTHTFARSWINEFRVSPNRDANLQANPTDRTTPAQLGFTNVSPANAPGVAPPVIFTPRPTLAPYPPAPPHLHTPHHPIL